MKTVLFLTRRFYPQIGGVEKHVLKVAEGLVKKGYKIIIIAESLTNDGIESKVVSEAKWQSRYMSDKMERKNDLLVKSTKIPYSEITDLKSLIKLNTSNITDDLLPNIIVYRLPSVKPGRLKKFFIWWWFLGNRKIFSSVDIVHCHDVFFWYLPFRILYLRKPVFTTFHGYEEYPVPTKNIFIRKLSEKLSNGNICIGDFMTKWYGTKPTFISYGGVDDINPREPEYTNSAVFIGRLDKQTGILMYLKAVELIKKKYPAFKFTVVGDGIYRDKIDKDTAHLGFLDESRAKKQLLAHEYAFVSRYLSILEAMMAKRIVFAVYDNDIKRDYLTITPFKEWINIVNNEKELYNLVDHYIRHPEEENKKIEQAYNWVKDQSWGNVVNLYIELWNLK